MEKENKKKNKEKKGEKGIENREMAVEKGNMEKKMRTEIIETE